MKKRFFIILLICVICLFTVCGCIKSNNTVSASDEIRTIDEIGGNTPAPAMKHKTELKEVKSTSEPESESYVSALTASDADSFFAVQTCAVKGTVKSVKEYRVDESYDDIPEDHFYFSVLALKVDKQYGDAELKYRKKGVIYVRYRQNSHDRIDGYADLLKGDECILFLQDVAVNPPEFMSLDDAVYDYDMVFSSQSALKKTEAGYDAQGFMALFGKQKRYYKLSEIERIINKNVDKMKGMSYWDVMFPNSSDD